MLVEQLLSADPSERPSAAMVAGNGWVAQTANQDDSLLKQVLSSRI